MCDVRHFAFFVMITLPNLDLTFLVCVYRICLLFFVVLILGTVFYMRFSRLIPRAIPIATLSDLLIYVMNSMHDKERDCIKGIGLIADLTDFTMSQFSIPYMIKFFMLVQGRVFPVKVESVLFTNAPKWFDKIWGILKQMMSTEFLHTNVHRVSFHDMVMHHLEPGWERYMTDDVFLGNRNADQIVAEFIEQRKVIERSRLVLD